VIHGWMEAVLRGEPAQASLDLPLSVLLMSATTIEAAALMSAPSNSLSIFFSSLVLP
jgi:hypothetical protein